MNDLIKSKYKEFKSMPFPDDASDNEELGEIHLDLVLFDSFVAGSLDKFLSREVVEKEDLIYKEDLENRIVKILNESKSQYDIDVAKTYLEYLFKLKELLQLIQSQSFEGSED